MNDLLKKRKTKEWLIFSFMFLIFIFFEFFIELLYYAFGYDLNNLTTNDVIFIIILKYIVLMILFGFIYRKYLIDKWKDFLHHFKSYFSISFKNWFAGFLIMIISNIIITSFVKGLGQNESNVQSLIEHTPIIAFFITTIFAPIIEEMLFRKCLQNCFNNKIFYMIFSGFIFGLVHVIGFNNPLEYLLIIPYGSIGLMFAKTINETDNIYSTILLHMLHNGALTLISILGVL